MEPLRIASATSPADESIGLFHSEKLSALRPPSTSFCTSHDTGAMFVYQRHIVRLLWQSKQARCASARVCAESHFGSCVTGGFEWLRPYGTAWIKAKRITRPAADMSRIRFHRGRVPSRRTPAASG